MANTRNHPRVYIAENNQWVRQTLRVFLRQYMSFEVIGESETRESVIQGVAACAPDVLILAWELPGGVDRGLIQTLREKRPQMKIISLGSHPEAEKSALLAGVDAFVSKGDPPEFLEAALNLDAF
jgi:DNA-binding NarL/FixJ family response regulator